MFDAEVTPQTSLAFDVATAAIKGKRDYQEDSMIASFPVGQGSGFAIIADGIGGHVAGHIASALVTTEVFTHLKMQEALLTSGALDVPFALRQAAEQANKKLAAHIETNKDTEGMGSTLLVPVIRGDRLSWISIGDSPLYLLRDGALRLLNKDHSMAPQIDMLVKAGSMTVENGKDHPDRNTLTSIVGGDDIPEIDCPASPIRLKDGDILIASSDGLQSLSNESIADVLMQGKDRRSIDIVNAFLKAIEARGHPDQDNAAFAVIMAHAEAKVEDVMDIDAMPVLAQAGQSSAPAPVEAGADPAAASVPDESKAYYYRGQKYYRD